MLSTCSWKLGIVRRIEHHVEVADGRLEADDGLALAAGRDGESRQERGNDESEAQTKVHQRHLGESAGRILCSGKSRFGESPETFSLIDGSKCVKRCAFSRPDSRGRL